jgi:hypothetical protein
MLYSVLFASLHHCIVASEKNAFHPSRCSHSGMSKRLYLPASSKIIPSPLRQAHVPLSHSPTTSSRPFRHYSKSHNPTATISSPFQAC